MPRRVEISPAVFWVPYGYPSLTTFYIDETEYFTVTNFEIVQRLNEMSQFKAELVGVDDTAKTHIKRNSIVKVFSENTLIFKGRIERCEYDSNQFAKIKGNGIELKLRDEFVTRNVSNESLFEDVDSTTIVSQTASGVMSVGTNNSLGKLTIRGDYDNKLAIIAGTAEAGGGDWWVSHGEFPYNTDYINVDTRRGSTSPVMTFNISGANANIIESRKEQDWDALKNSITVLGYGDGTNQLISKCFHATNTRTTLASDITASDMTISLTDASGFPSSGSVWIGCEKVSYTGKSGNDLTGCTRGVAFMGNVTEAYAHKAGIAVYDAAYTETSAETDSSIGDGSDTNNANYGLRRGVYSYPDIFDQNTLDLLAQNILEDHKDLVERITLIPVDFRNVLNTVEVGDTVTINDSDAGLSGNYRVVGMTFRNKEGYESLELEVSNAKTRFTGAVQNVQKETQKKTRYMQGATNCYMTGETDNCDSSHGLRIDFYIPKEAVGINKVKLNYKLLKYRIWSTVTAKESSHTHGIPELSVSGTTSSSETAKHSHSVSGTTSTTVGSSDNTYEFGPYTDTPTIDNSWHAVNTSVQIGNYAYESHHIAWNIKLAWTTVDVCQNLEVYVRAKNTTDSTYYPSSTGIKNIIYFGHFGTNNEAHALFGHIRIPKSWTSKSYQLEYKIEAPGGAASITSRDISYLYYGIRGHAHSVSGQTAEEGGASHSHTISGQTTVADTTGAGSEHSHALSYGISTDTAAWGVSDITINVDGTDRTSEIETAKGSALTTSEGGTENGDYMDLKNYLSSPIADNWHYVIIQPNGNCRIRADLFIQIFIESD